MMTMMMMVMMMIPLNCMFTLQYGIHDKTSYCMFVFLPKIQQNYIYLFWRRIASKLYIDAATVDCDGDHDNIDEKDDENNEDNDESVVCSK